MKKTTCNYKPCPKVSFAPNEIAESLYKTNLNYSSGPNEALQMTMDMMSELGVEEYTLTISIKA